MRTDTDRKQNIKEEHMPLGCFGITNAWVMEKYEQLVHSKPQCWWKASVTGQYQARPVELDGIKGEAEHDRNGV